MLPNTEVVVRPLGLSSEVLGLFLSSLHALKPSTASDNENHIAPVRGDIPLARGRARRFIIEPC
jgi:hypothetical protein